MPAVHGMESTAGTMHTAPGTGAAGPGDRASPGEGLDVHLGRLTDAGRAWIGAKREHVVMRAKRVAILAAVGVAGAIAAAATVATSIFLLLAGLADVLQTALGLAPGSGGLIVGGSVLVALALGAWLGLRRVQGAWSARVRSGPTADQRRTA
jgi:hypothetical protein